LVSHLSQDWKISGHHAGGRLGKASDVLGDAEADILAFPDGLWISAANGVKAEENVLPFFAADKTGAYFMIEPFDLPCWHKAILSSGLLLQILT